MLLTNHALTGAVLALNLPNPEILAPVAFASHLAMDGLPHVGSKSWGKLFDTPSGRAVGVLDSTVALTSYLLVLHFFPQYWLMITVGVFFACLPDLFYVPQIVFGVIWDKSLRRLHAWVQWSETPSGIVGDIAWASAMVYILVR